MPPYDPAELDGRWTRRFKLFLRAASYIALTIVIFSQEYHLAKELLGLQGLWAAALPIAIDIYILSAFIARRDIVWALTVMGLTFGAAVLVRALDDGGLEWKDLGEAALGVVVVIVAWRVNELNHGDAAVRHRKAEKEAAAAARAAERQARMAHVLANPVTVTAEAPSAPLAQVVQMRTGETAAIPDLIVAAENGAYAPLYDWADGIHAATGQWPKGSDFVEVCAADTIASISDPVQWGKDRRKAAVSRAQKRQPA